RVDPPAIEADHDKRIATSVVRAFRPAPLANLKVRTPIALLPSNEADSEPAVHQAWRSDRRRQRADEVLAIEEVLHAEEDFEIPPDCPRTGEIDQRVFRQTRLGESRHETRVLIVVELSAQ